MDGPIVCLPHHQSTRVIPHVTASVRRDIPVRGWNDRLLRRIPKSHSFTSLQKYRPSLPSVANLLPDHGCLYVLPVLVAGDDCRSGQCIRELPPARFAGNSTRDADSDAAHTVAYRFLLVDYQGAAQAGAEQAESWPVIPFAAFAVEHWHTGIAGAGQELHDYLSFTWSKYPVRPPSIRFEFHLANTHTEWCIRFHLEWAAHWWNSYRGISGRVCPRGKRSRSSAPDRFSADLLPGFPGIPRRDQR